MSHSNTSLVSVGLPVFNGERYLAEAVESVLAQDFEDFELILCDNASTDATRDICQGYAAADSRVRYVGSERNRGAAWNYNRAVDFARGRYFRWMTHDDLIAPSCLSACLEALEHGPEDLVLVYPRTTVIDAEGRHVEDYEDRAESLSNRPHERIRGLLRNLTLCNAVVGLTPLEVLRSTRRIGSWPASDKTLLIELALRGKILELPERLFLRRRDDSLPSPTNMEPEERARWFDPRSAGSRCPRTVLIRETLRAVHLSPLSIGAKARCQMTVVRDAIRHRRAVARELGDLLLSARRPAPGAKASGGLDRSAPGS